MTNAGYYDLKVSVIADSNHLFYDTYKEDSTATQICELHQPVVIYPHEVTMWIGLNHNLDITYYSSNDTNPKFYYKEGQSIAYSIERFSDLADTNNTAIYQNLDTTTLVTNTMETLPTCITYYRASESAEWATATNTTDVGFYKNVYKFTSVDSYTNNQTLEYTGEELTPEYEIVVIGWDLAYDYPRSYFIISRVTKQNDVEVTPIDVGEYVTTITIKIYKPNFTIDDTWKASLTGLTEEGNFYCITRTINWSIVANNA